MFNEAHKTRVSAVLTSLYLSRYSYSTNMYANTLAYIPRHIRRGSEMTYTYPYISISIRQLTDRLAPESMYIPLVGIHARRTDKILVEAKSRPLEEDIQLADQYFLEKKRKHIGRQKRARAEK